MRIVSEPPSVDGPSVPKWNVDHLASEMEHAVKKLNISNKTTSPMTRGFVMRVSEYDDDDDDSQIHSAYIRCYDEFDLLVKLHEKEWFQSGIARYNANRIQVDRKLDLEYQRTTSQALCQEEDKSRERAHQEEQLCQEKARAEENVVIESVSVADNSATSIFQAARSTLALEKRRLKQLEHLEDMNQSIKSCSEDGYSLFERHIASMVEDIRGTKGNVTAKANEIITTFEDPSCPVCISIATFAKKMVVSASCLNPFVWSYVIVYVTSQFPLAMDILLAEFHKACSYTIPKHDVNSESVWDSEAYRRLDSVMRLYGALVQTDIQGATNRHGIEHGLTWLARFFNSISAYDRASATALNAFLQTAGFGLHQRYKSHFLKVVNVVRDYLAMLRAKKDSSDLQVVITEITMYIDDHMYLKEPGGRTLATSSYSLNK